MPNLIGITGYSGAGKTTAIKYLKGRTGADRIYVGQIVADEVVKLGMPPGPSSEKAVRVKLRDIHGMEGLAVLAAPVVGRSLNLGKTVIIDAICCLEEMQYYRTAFDSEAELVSILTPFELRAERVAARHEKALTINELLERDELEKNVLGTGRAIDAATVAIYNDGDLSRLHKQLDEQVCQLIQPA